MLNLRYQHLRQRFAFQLEGACLESLGEPLQQKMGMNDDQNGVSSIPSILIRYAVGWLID